MCRIATHWLTFATIAACFSVLTVPRYARADRIILSPDGNTLPANSMRGEFEISPYRNNGNLAWLQYALPLGIEIEVQRADLLPAPRALTSLNIQYPLIPDIGNYPALSLGVRDLLGTGYEHRSFYVATTKAFALSDRQMHVLRDIRLSAGFGTERIDGLFIGVQARLTLGMSLYAEIYRQRPNVSIGLPVVRNLQVRATSLDGTIFYGLSFSARH
jgi:hypothetical protein